MMDRTGELLNKPYWIIDILPKRVQETSGGQYFRIEKYFLANQLDEIRQKHLNLILKLNCYIDISVNDEFNPAPEKIRNIMNKQDLCITAGNTVILSEHGDTYMTVFNPDKSFLKLIIQIASGEGLFVWKP